MESLLTIDETAFKQTYAKSPIKRIKRERLLRNAAIAAGNSGRSELIDPLKRLLIDESELVRSHAAWALARLGAS